MIFHTASVITSISPQQTVVLFDPIAGAQHDRRWQRTPIALGDR
jgi:hypothetical protein